MTTLRSLALLTTLALAAPSCAPSPGMRPAAAGSQPAVPRIPPRAPGSQPAAHGIQPAAHGPVAKLIDLRNPELVSSSRNLAAGAIRHSPQFDRRLDFMSSRLLSRKLTEGERTYLTGPRERTKAFYRSHPEAARQLAGPGLAGTSADPVELATWTVLAAQVRHIDSFMARWAAPRR